MPDKHPDADFTDNGLYQKLKNINGFSSNPGKNNPEYWNRRAPSFADHAGKTFYPDSFIKIMNPEPSWTVLDMGCGGGTLALPLAGRVKHITAVDFSEKMIEILRTESDRRGINNIETIHSGWTDNWEETGISTYDVAIASRSLAVDDIRAAIDKLNNAARKRVIISTIVGDGPFDRRMLEAAGRERTQNVDYIYFYNLLFKMGIFANISFIAEQESKTFSNREEAFESYKWMFQDITQVEELKLKKYLEDHLVNVNGRLEMDYKRKVRWAVIWWDRED